MIRFIPAIAFALISHVAFAAVDLNTATKDDLVALSGIGPAKAQAILDYRTEHGGFKSVDELKSVKGIGAKQFERLRPELTVASVPAKAAPRQEARSAGGKADPKVRK
ncbi:MAG TPA: helix-hairpin-helix domain-containing protein [Casimicrobiaceae bacterium]|nr:helix-hairpin-helix domain-containing protein [Casimicrobiaceae bacterium]